MKQPEPLRTHYSVCLTRAVTVCGWLGDGAGQRATPRLSGEFVELLLLLHKLDLLWGILKKKVYRSCYALSLNFKCFLEWKTKAKQRRFWLNCSSLKDCLLNLICNSTLHIPPNITRQQRTMQSGFLGIKLRKTVHSFTPDRTGWVQHSLPQSDCYCLILAKVWSLFLSDFWR